MCPVDPHDAAHEALIGTDETFPETDEILEIWATAGDDAIEAVVFAEVPLDGLLFDGVHLEEVHRHAGFHPDGMTEIVCDLREGAMIQGSNHHPRLTILISSP
ncbi:hypothetical protein PC116_g33097 [Phytophthora cactorum]|nr:hypothetical protein PC116_g33097 [Phytophthora cactorum]